MKYGNVHEHPGHLVRRLHQISVSIFTEVCREYGITSIQYAILYMVGRYPGLDQISLANTVALDRSNTGDVVTRLEEKGLISRAPGAKDRRTKVLTLTAAGEAAVAAMSPDVESVQKRLLEPLDPSERETFMGLLAKLVDINNVLSRAPRRTSLPTKNTD